MLYHLTQLYPKRPDPHTAAQAKTLFDASDDSAQGALNHLLLVRAMFQPIDQGYINTIPCGRECPGFLDELCICVGHLIRMGSEFARHSDPKSAVAMCTCFRSAQTAVGVLYMAAHDATAKYNDIQHLATEHWLNVVKAARTAASQCFDKKKVPLVVIMWTLDLFELSVRVLPEPNEEANAMQLGFSMIFGLAKSAMQMKVADGLLEDLSSAASMGIKKLQQMNAKRVYVPIHAFLQARGTVMSTKRWGRTWKPACAEEMKQHIYSLQRNFLENDPNAEMLAAFGTLLSDLVRWLCHAEFHNIQDRPLEAFMLWLVEGEEQEGGDEHGESEASATVAPAAFLGLRGLASFGTKVSEERSTAELIKIWCVEKVMGGGELDVNLILGELKKIAENAINSLVSEVNRTFREKSEVVGAGLKSLIKFEKDVREQASKLDLGSTEEATSEDVKLDDLAKALVGFSAECSQLSKAIVAPMIADGMKGLSESLGTAKELLSSLSQILSGDAKDLLKATVGSLTKVCACLDTVWPDLARREHDLNVKKACAALDRIDRDVITPSNKIISKARLSLRSGREADQKGLRRMQKDLLEDGLKTHMHGEEGLKQSLDTLREHFESAIDKAVNVTSVASTIGLPALKLVVPPHVQLDKSFDEVFHVLDTAQGKQSLNGKPIYGTSSHRIWFAREGGMTSGRWYVGTIEQLPSDHDVQRVKDAEAAASSGDSEANLPAEFKELGEVVSREIKLLQLPQPIFSDSWSKAYPTGFSEADITAKQCECVLSQTAYKLNEDLERSADKLRSAAQDQLHAIYEESESRFKEAMVGAASEVLGIKADHIEGTMAFLTDTFVPVVGLVSGGCDTNVSAWKVRSAVVDMLNRHQAELEQALGRCTNAHHRKLLERLLMAIEKLVLNRHCFEVDHRVTEVLSVNALGKCMAEYENSSWVDPKLEQTMQAENDLAKLEELMQRAQEKPNNKKVKAKLQKVQRSLLENPAAVFTMLSQMKTHLVHLEQGDEARRRQQRLFEEEQDNIKATLTGLLDDIAKTRQKIEQADEEEIMVRERLIMHVRKQQLLVKQTIANVKDAGAAVGAVLDFLEGMQKDLDAINSKLDGMANALHGLELRVAGRPPPRADQHAKKSDAGTG